MGSKVIDFRPKYADQLAVLDQCWVAEGVTLWRSSPKQPEFFREHADSDGGIVKVLLEDEEPIGFIWGYVKKDDRDIPLQGEDGVLGYVDSIYLKPEYRSMGFGKKLMESFVQSCIQARCSYIELIADNIDPEMIHSFYKSLGFTSMFVRMRKEVG